MNVKINKKQAKRILKNIQSDQRKKTIVILLGAGGAKPWDGPLANNLETVITEDDRFVTTTDQIPVGYGNLNSDFWFIGKEEAGGESKKDIEARLNAWKESNKSEVADLYEFHDRIFSYKCPETSNADLSKFFDPIIDYDIVCPDCFVYAHKKLEMGNTGYDTPYCPLCKRKLSDKENRDIDCTQDTNTDTVYPGFFLDHMDDPQFFERLENTPHVIKKIDENKFPELTFEQKVFIGALAKFSIEEDMSTIVLLNAMKRRISPQYKWLMNILKELNLGNSFYELSEKYVLTIDGNITDYLFSPHDFFEASAEEILIFWEKLNYYEAAEYYLDKMEDVNFHTKIGAKTETILKALVSEFSIGQIWAIIHKSIQGGCEFFAKNGGDRAYATNSVIGACQRKAEFYKSSEYRLTPYSRPWLVRRSDISYYFFDTLLGIGEKNTELLPSIKTIQALIS